MARAATIAILRRARAATGAVAPAVGATPHLGSVATISLAPVPGALRIALDIAGGGTQRERRDYREPAQDAGALT